MLAPGTQSACIEQNAPGPRPSAAARTRRHASCPSVHKQRLKKRSTESQAGCRRVRHGSSMRAIHGMSPERPITVVEIGSSRGRSTIAAGHALRGASQGGTLYAIDPQDDDRFQQLRTNLSSAGVESVVRMIRATSREARKQFAEPVDLIFIDGSHEYEDVRDDLRDWLPLVRPGGIVAVNDPFWWGVARALRERLRLRGPLRSPRFVDNTLFFSYLPDAGWTREDDRELFRVHACVRGRAHWRLAACRDRCGARPARAGKGGAAARHLRVRSLRLLAWVLPAAEA